MNTLPILRSLVATVLLFFIGCEDSDTRYSRELGEAHGYRGVTNTDELADLLFDDRRCAELEKLRYHEYAERCRNH